MKHDHSKRITNLSYSQNGEFFVSTSSDMCKVWRIHKHLMGSYMIFPGGLDSEYTEDSVNPVACCDNQARLVAIYKGKLHFQIYEVPN